MARQVNQTIDQAVAVLNPGTKREGNDVNVHRRTRPARPVSMAEAAQAHAADLRVQPEFGVHYLRYWVDEQHGKIFALVNAPNAVAAHAVHRMAHGLVPGAIFPVREGH